MAIITSGGETYRQVADYFEVSIDTIRKYKQTAAKIKIGIRNPDLSFSHHRVIASLPQVEQRQWLAVAAKGNWTVRQLRKNVNEVLGIEPSPMSYYARLLDRLETLTKEYRVSVEREFWERADEIADEIEQLSEDMRENTKSSRKMLKGRS